MKLTVETIYGKEISINILSQYRQKTILDLDLSVNCPCCGNEFNANISHIDNYLELQPGIFFEHNTHPVFAELKDKSIAIIESINHHLPTEKKVISEKSEIQHILI